MEKKLYLIKSWEESEKSKYENNPNVGDLVPITAERNVVSFPQLALQNDSSHTDDIPSVVPRLKSMTWSVENKGEMPTNRVAIITLKVSRINRLCSSHKQIMETFSTFSTYQFSSYYVTCFLVMDIGRN